MCMSRLLMAISSADVVNYGSAMSRTGGAEVSLSPAALLSMRLEIAKGAHKCQTPCGLAGTHVY